MATESVLYELNQAGVATITLNDPDTRNALSAELLLGLIAAFGRARDDEAVRCVVLASSHEKVFSSGANLSGFAGDVSLVHKHFGSERFVALYSTVPDEGAPTDAPDDATLDVTWNDEPEVLGAPSSGTVL